MDTRSGSTASALDVAQDRLQAVIEGRTVEVIVVHELANHMRLDTKGFGGRNMDAGAILARVQAGHLPGDQLAVPGAERRGSTHQRLVILDELRGHLGKTLKDLEEDSLAGQRREKRHGVPLDVTLPRLGAGDPTLAEDLRGCFELTEHARGKDELEAPVRVLHPDRLVQTEQLLERDNP